VLVGTRPDLAAPNKGRDGQRWPVLGKELYCWPTGGESVANQQHDGGRVVEIGGLTVLALTTMFLMDCFLTCSQTYLLTPSDSLRNTGNHYEGGEQEREGRSAGDQIWTKRGRGVY